MAQGVLKNFAPLLVRVLRWQDEHRDLYTAEESVFEHVRGMLVLWEQILDMCPQLGSFCDADVVKLMVVLHDIGEIATGDMPRTHRGKETEEEYKRRKQSEAEAALRLIAEHCDGDGERLQGLYRRVISRSPEDAEAWLTKLLDIAQGTDFGAQHVFPFRAPFGVGYERCGDVLEPPYYTNLLSSTLVALRIRRPITQECALRFQVSMYATLFQYLGTYRRAEIVEGIRTDFNRALQIACQTTS